MTYISGTCLIQSLWRINEYRDSSCLNGGWIILKVASIYHRLATPSNCNWRSVANTICRRELTVMSPRMKLSGTWFVSISKHKSFGSDGRIFSRWWFAILSRFPGFRTPGFAWSTKSVITSFTTTDAGRKTSAIAFFLKSLRTRSFVAAPVGGGWLCAPFTV